MKSEQRMSPVEAIRALEIVLAQGHDAHIHMWVGQANFQVYAKVYVEGIHVNPDRVMALITALRDAGFDPWFGDGASAEGYIHIQVKV